MSGRYEFIRAMAKPVTWLSMRLEVKGIERVPTTGPTLLVSNHLGHTDPLAIALRMRRELRLVGKVQIFSWFFVGWAARMVDAIPLKRGESDREAMRTVLGLLSRGECVLVFPEGTYSRAPDPAAMLPLQTGPAWLALRSGAVIVPVALTGTELVWHLKRGWRPWQRPRVTVTFGEPFAPPPGTAVTRTALESLTTQMAQRIAALLPPTYQGHYEHLAALPS